VQIWKVKIRPRLVTLVTPSTLQPFNDVTIHDSRFTVQRFFACLPCRLVTPKRSEGGSQSKTGRAGAQPRRKPCAKVARRRWTDGFAPPRRASCGEHLTSDYRHPTSDVCLERGIAASLTRRTSKSDQRAPASDWYGCTVRKKGIRFL
jgi:hypothetical protein